MTNEVTIAIISLISATIVAGLSFLGQVLMNKKKSQEDAVKEAKRQQYNEDRDDYFNECIQKINKKLDEHNHYAKKFEEVNISLTGMQKDIEYIRKELGNGTRKSKTKKD